MALSLPNQEENNNDHVEALLALKGRAPSVGSFKSESVDDIDHQASAQDSPIHQGETPDKTKTSKRNRSDDPESNSNSNESSEEDHKRRKKQKRHKSNKRKQKRDKKKRKSSSKNERDKQKESSKKTNKESKKETKVLTEEEKKEEARKAANRKSAYKSRLRRKLTIQELHSTVESLEKQAEENQTQMGRLEAQLYKERDETTKLQWQIMQHQQAQQQQSNMDMDIRMNSNRKAPAQALAAAPLPSVTATACLAASIEPREQPPQQRQHDPPLQQVESVTDENETAKKNRETQEICQLLTLLIQQRAQQSQTMEPAVQPTIATTAAPAISHLQQLPSSTTTTNSNTSTCPGYSFSALSSPQQQPIATTIQSQVSSASVNADALPQGPSILPPSGTWEALRSQGLASALPPSSTAAPGETPSSFAPPSQGPSQQQQLQQTPQDQCAYNQEPTSTIPTQSVVDQLQSLMQTQPQLINALVNWEQNKSL